jgi:hypothetical protein
MNILGAIKKEIVEESNTLDLSEKICILCREFVY